MKVIVDTDDVPLSPSGASRPPGGVWLLSGFKFCVTGAQAEICWRQRARQSGCLPTARELVMTCTTTGKWRRHFEQAHEAPHPELSG
jgi:hypothetical protein